MPPVVQRLREAAAGIPGDRVSMQALAQAHGPDAHGTLLLLLAMPCLLPVPGVGTVLGLGMAALALSIWRGEVAPCLPQRVAGLELPAQWARRVLSALAGAYAMAGQYARARLGHLTGGSWRPVIASAVALMAVIIVLPIPFGNLLPALTLVLIGLGLVFRDGLALALGLAGAALALVVTAGIVLVAWSWANGAWAAFLPNV